MSGLFIFIGTHRIKEGKLEDFKRYAKGFVEFIEAEEPRLIAFNLYLNKDGTELTVVQVHPDQDSMRFHMQVAGEHFAEAYEFLEGTERIEIHGAIGGDLEEQIRQVAGAPVMVWPHHLGGFTRSKADRAHAPS